VTRLTRPTRRRKNRRGRRGLGLSRRPPPHFTVSLHRLTSRAAGCGHDREALAVVPRLHRHHVAVRLHERDRERLGQQPLQPVVVRQTIPPIPSGITGIGSPTASVRVEIGTDGRVLNASMQQSSHPLYDRLVLQAAREWLYTPAMLNGRPVPSEKVVTIQLR